MFPVLSVSLPKVSIAVDHAPPFAVIAADGEISGAVIDIVKSMQQYYDFEVELIGCPFPRCLKMLEEGDVDIMGGLILTPKRANKFHFVSPPYMVLSSSFVFYARADSDLDLNTYEELLTKKIAVIRGAAHFSRFDNDTRLEKVEALTEVNAFDMLFKKRVDLVIAVEKTADYAAQIVNRPTQKLKKMTYRYDDTIYGHMAFSSKFAKTPLANDLQKAMHQLVLTGELSRIVAPYNLPPIPRQ